MKRWKLNNRIRGMYHQDNYDENDLIVIPKSLKHTLPSHIDLRKYCPKAKDARKMYDIKSCMTHVVLTCLEMMMNISIVENDITRYFKKTKKRSQYYNDFVKSNHSNFFIEEFLHKKTILENKGNITYRTILHTLYQTGCEFHYKDKSISKYKIIEYARIDGSGKKRVKNNFLYNLKTTLASGIPIIGSIKLPYSLAKHEIIGTGVIKMHKVKRKKYFNYGILIIGFNDNMEKDGYKGFLIFQNSWSHNWGDQGFGYIPYKLVQKLSHLDFWIISSFDFDCIDTNGYKQMYYDSNNHQCLFKIEKSKI